MSTEPQSDETSLCQQLAKQHKDHTATYEQFVTHGKLSVKMNFMDAIRQILDLVYQGRFAYNLAIYACTCECTTEMWNVLIKAMQDYSMDTPGMKTLLFSLTQSPDQDTIGSKLMTLIYYYPEYHNYILRCATNKSVAVNINILKSSTDPSNLYTPCVDDLKYVCQTATDLQNVHMLSWASGLIVDMRR